MYKLGCIAKWKPIPRPGLLSVLWHKLACTTHCGDNTNGGITHQLPELPARSQQAELNLHVVKDAASGQCCFASLQRIIPDPMQLVIKRT